MPSKRLKALIFTLLTSAGSLLQAQLPITISLDTTHPGASIAPDFTGLSFETALLLPDTDGVRYFRPDNQPLITLFHTLGIKNLRVGGNTSDRNAHRLPDHADIDSLFAFARSADVKVIYCLRLHDGDPQQDAAVAKYIMDRYSNLVASFSIGQEPNVYPKVTNALGVVTPRPPYSVYAKSWNEFENAIVAAVPDAKFSGPGVDDNASWPRQFIADFGQGHHVALVTAHQYPGRSGDKVPSPEIGRDRMLSPSFIDEYQKFYDGFGPVARANDLPYRLEEANNFFNGGAAGVSDTFASALWGLDFMFWWAEHGAAGINFHTGDKVAAGTELRPSKYTAYFTTEGGFSVRPLGYGIKAFDLAGHGKIIPITISNPHDINVNIYAVHGDDGNFYVTVINKEHGDNAKNANLSFGNTDFASVQTMSLNVPNNAVTAKYGMTLGGAEIKNDGTWEGKWTTPRLKNKEPLILKVPAASAVIIRLTEN